MACCLAVWYDGGQKPPTAHPFQKLKTSTHLTKRGGVLMGRKRILNLTPRPRKAAELIAFNEDGRSYKAIADDVGVHENTLRA